VYEIANQILSLGIQEISQKAQRAIYLKIDWIRRRRLFNWHGFGSNFGSQTSAHINLAFQLPTRNELTYVYLTLGSSGITSRLKSGQ